MEDKKYFLNPVTILLIIFLSTFIIFMGNTFLQYTVAVIGFLILLKQDFKLFLKFLVIYIAMGVLIYYVLDHALYDLIQVRFFYPLLVFFYKVWPLVVMARSIGTFTSSELMNAYRKIGLKDQFCIAIAVFFRFVPEFKHRMREIKEAVKIRNLNPSILHPIRSFEVFLVPMIYRGLSISDIITASIITKGIEYPCKKTSYRDLNFKLSDIVFALIFLALLGVSIWLKIS